MNNHPGPSDLVHAVSRLMSQKGEEQNEYFFPRGAYFYNTSLNIWNRNADSQICVFVDMCICGKGNKVMCMLGEGKQKGQ